jgi:hypothetical protein
MYKFQSRASGDVLMLTPVGDRLLALIGKTPAPKGIIDVAALPAAIEALQTAVEADDAVGVSLARSMDDPLDEPSGPRAISLRQRAWPLVELLRRSLAEEQPVLWGV